MAVSMPLHTNNYHFVCFFFKDGYKMLSCLHPLLLGERDSKMYDQVLKEMWAVHRSQGQDFERFIQNALKLYVFLTYRRMLLHVISFPYTTTVVAVQLLNILVARGRKGII